MGRRQRPAANGHARRRRGVHLDCHVVRACLQRSGHIPAIRLPAMLSQLLAVERDLRIVIHTRDLQINMPLAGQRGHGELLLVRGRPGKAARAQVLPRLQCSRQLLPVQVHTPVAIQRRHRQAIGKRRLRRGYLRGHRPHDDHLRLIRPQHQREGHSIARVRRGGHGMNLSGPHLPVLRLAMTRNRCHARLGLVALVEEVVHIAVGPRAVRVGQPRERGVQLHIRRGQRRQHRRRNVAAGLHQRREAQIGNILRVHESLVDDQRRRLAHKDHLATLLGKRLQPLQAGARNHRHRRQHDGLVSLPTQIDEGPVLQRRHRAQRLLVKVVPIHLVLEQLPAELGGAAVSRNGIIAAHPYAVAGVIECDLRRWPSHGHQVAAAVGVPRNHRRLRRNLRRRPRARLTASRPQHRHANLHRIHAAHKLEVELVLAVDAGAAALFGPHLRPAKQVRRRRSQLGEVVIDVPHAVRPVYRARDQLAQVVDARHLHVALIAEVVALAALQRQHRLLVVQVDQVLHVVLLRPLRLLAEERAPEDAAPHVVVVRTRSPRGIRRLLVSEPRGNIRQQVVALLRLELCQQRRRPRYTARVVRLIAEEPHHDLAELVTHRRTVGLMHRRQERIRRLRVQVVDDRVRRILGARPVGAVEVPRRRAQVNVPHELHLPEVARLIRRGALSRRQPAQVKVRRHRNGDHLLDLLLRVGLNGHDRQRVRRHRHLQRLPRLHMHRDVVHNVLHPKLRIALADIAAGKSAGVVGLILNP